MFSYWGATASMVLEGNQKSIISVPTVDWNYIKGHSYLRLATPSGNIYHFTDNKGIGNQYICFLILTKLY